MECCVGPCRTSAEGGRCHFHHSTCLTHEIVHADSVHPSKHIIPPGTTTEVHSDFWLTPPVKKERETVRVDIALVDQFGNEHWVKGVEFKYR